MAASFRSTLTRRLSDYLDSKYNGPITIHRETSKDTIHPPFAVIRIPDMVELAPGQVEIWDCTVVVAVFQDHAATSAETAEERAQGLFEKLEDGDDVMAYCDDEIAFSAFEGLGSEMSISGPNWQHAAVFHVIASPRF